MTARQLPERPSIDQLKHQAKDLLRAARAHDADALARFRTLPAFARQSDADLSRASLGLHDAQSVIAREYGLDSWNALRERVEELTLEFGAATDGFIEAATDGRADRAERLLALYPAIARANVYAALVLGDRDTVERRLAERPGLATERGGPRGWEPLHYVCYTSVGARSGSREAGLVAIARRLIDARRRSQPAVPLAASRGGTAGALGRRVRRALAPARQGAARCGRQSERRRDAPARGQRGRRRRARSAAGLRSRRESAVGDRRLRAALRDSPLVQDRGWRAVVVGARRGSRSGVCRERRNAAACGGWQLGRGVGRGAGQSWRGCDPPACRWPYGVRGGRVERQSRRRSVAAGARSAGRVIRRRSARGGLQPRRPVGGGRDAGRTAGSPQRDRSRALSGVLPRGGAQRSRRARGHARVRLRSEPRRRVDRQDDAARRGDGGMARGGAVCSSSTGPRSRSAIASSTRRRSFGPPKDRVRRGRTGTMQRWAGCSWTPARRSSGRRARSPPRRSWKS